LAHLTGLSPGPRAPEKLEGNPEMKKYFLATLTVALVIVAGAVTSFAQTGELRGHVWMQQTDGTKVPLAEAQIDVFRLDLKAEYKTKTNKKGEFVFAGLPYVGNYAVAASHPTAGPNFVNFKVGRGDSCEIVLQPGNGKRLTLDEIKTYNASTPAAAGPAANSGGGESAADKAKREELIRKNKEIEEGNRKIEAANVVLQRTFKAGNDALIAAQTASKANNTEEAVKNYSTAVTQYEEGLTADPEQPVLLTQKAIALKGRGVEKYNATVRKPPADEAAKNAALDSAKADFKAAAETSNQAVEMTKKQTPPTDPAALKQFSQNKYAAFVANAEAMRLFVTKVDQSKADAGFAAFKEYIELETDPAKKAKAQLDAAQMLFDAGSADKALTEFQAILATSPDSPEANLGAGLALYSSGDKAKYQEAANYLQHFVDIAPDGQVKTEAKAILAELKNTEKVEPVKTPARRGRRP
jgi:tetratricopeptide (TPR) repeat protein